MFRPKLDAGRKLLAPYITAGYRDDWVEVLHAIAEAGADAIEIGIPFSDPLMDGPVIQEATRIALENGATPPKILDALADVDVDIPLVVMTSYNICFRAGHERFVHDLASVGVSGAILPDLPVDEATSWCETAAAAGIDAVLLAAPTTPDDRLAEICKQTSGFVYAVGRLGTTGGRETLSDSASLMARRLKEQTTKPVLVGIGVMTADHAAQVCEVADGAIVGAAVVQRMLEGGPPEDVAAFVRELRSGLDRHLVR